MDGRFTSDSYVQFYLFHLCYYSDSLRDVNKNPGYERYPTGYDVV